MPPPTDEYAPYVARTQDIRMEIYGQAAATVGISLIDDATGSVQILRDMFEEQRTRPIKPFAGPKTTVEELVVSSAFWVDALREVLRSLGDHKPRIAKAVVDSGLLDLYQDIMLCSDFFSQHQAWMACT
ncbi:unnamed protein product [Peniophora sp. CBMAI 1063]|nr:unnamed protein product [Peniophora sp. CBMAI 1063]